MRFQELEETASAVLENAREIHGDAFYTRADTAFAAIIALTSVTVVALNKCEEVAAPPLLASYKAAVSCVTDLAANGLPLTQSSALRNILALLHQRFIYSHRP
jgi:hypothetical protein